MDSQRQSDRTWLIMIVGVVAIMLFGVMAWNQRAPANSVNEEAIQNIESQLCSDRFVLTNMTHMHSEAIAFGIPISKILGTSKDSVNLPFQRDGANLSIGYGLKRGHAFDISISADPPVAARANRIAAELAKINSAVALTVWTNELAPGASK